MQKKGEELEAAVGKEGPGKTGKDPVEYSLQLEWKNQDDQDLCQVLRSL